MFEVYDRDLFWVKVGLYVFTFWVAWSLVKMYVDYPVAQFEREWREKQEQQNKIETYKEILSGLKVNVNGYIVEPQLNFR